MSLTIPEVHGPNIPIARSGHTAVFHKGRLIIVGGFGQIAAVNGGGDFYAEPSYVWIYNIEFSFWTRIDTSGNVPQNGLSGSNACILNDSLVLHAGYEEDFSRTSTVYQLDLHSFQWRNLSEEGAIEGPVPPERDKLVSWSHNNQIIYFGGYGWPTTEQNGINGEFCYDDLGRGWNSTLSILDFSNSEKCKWRYPKVSGERPSPRAAHACTKINNTGFVFGGRSKEKRLNDMYSLNLNTLEWKKVTYTSEAPQGRSWHSLNNLSKTNLFLYGGLDNDGGPLSDMWIFNIVHSTWHEIKRVKERIGVYSPRMWHTGVNSNNEGEVIIFGGSTNSVLEREPSNHCNVVVIFRANPFSLQYMCLVRVVEYWGMLHHKQYMLPHAIQESIAAHLLAREESQQIL